MKSLIEVSRRGFQDLIVLLLQNSLLLRRECLPKGGRRLIQNMRRSFLRQFRLQSLYLTKTEYAILKQLLINPKQVITKTKLIELISNDTLDGDENSLKVHISNIRKKIRKITQEEYIEAVWGIGFKIHE